MNGVQRNRLNYVARAMKSTQRPVDAKMANHLSRVAERIPPGQLVGLHLTERLRRSDLSQEWAAIRAKGHSLSWTLAHAPEYEWPSTERCWVSRSNRVGGEVPARAITMYAFGALIATRRRRRHQESSSGSFLYGRLAPRTHGARADYLTQHAHVNEANVND